jgi:hypothetical protein
MEICRQADPTHKTEFPGPLDRQRTCHREARYLRPRDGQDAREWQVALATSRGQIAELAPMYSDDRLCLDQQLKKDGVEDTLDTQRDRC